MEAFQAPSVCKGREQVYSDPGRLRRRHLRLHLFRGNAVADHGKFAKHSRYFNSGTGDAASRLTSTCNITLNGDSSLIATFSSTGRHSLRFVIGLGGDGKGTINRYSTCQNFELGYSACTVFYARGSEVMFRAAVPQYFPDFSGGRTGGAALCGTAATCTFMLDPNNANPISLNASFAALTSVAVQASAATITVGQTQTFNAIGTFSNGATRSCPA